MSNAVPYKDQIEFHVGRIEGALLCYAAPQEVQGSLNWIKDQFVVVGEQQAADKKMDDAFARAGDAPREKRARKEWSEEEETTIITAIKDGKGPAEVAALFPDLEYSQVYTCITRLKAAGRCE